MEKRLALAADAPALAALHAESFGAAAWSLAQIAESLALETTLGLVAYDGGAVQGFVLCQITESEAEILTFCVTPSARRKGVGRDLLIGAQEATRQRQAQRLFLEVAADNTAALALYDQSGFRVIGKRSAYYSHDGKTVDAVMLGADL